SETKSARADDGQRPVRRARAFRRLEGAEVNWPGMRQDALGFETALQKGPGHKRTRGQHIINVLHHRKRSLIIVAGDRRKTRTPALMFLDQRGPEILGMRIAGIHKGKPAVGPHPLKALVGVGIARDDMVAGSQKLPRPAVEPRVEPESERFRMKLRQGRSRKECSEADGWIEPDEFGWQARHPAPRASRHQPQQVIFMQGQSFIIIDGGVPRGRNDESGNGHILFPKPGLGPANAPNEFQVALAQDLLAMFDAAADRPLAQLSSYSTAAPEQLAQPRMQIPAGRDSNLVFHTA